jgi:hypothetical protein
MDKRADNFRTANDMIFEALSEDLADTDFLVAKQRGKVLLDLGNWTYEVVAIKKHDERR